MSLCSTEKKKILKGECGRLIKIIIECFLSTNSLTSTVKKTTWRQIPQSISNNDYRTQTFFRGNLAKYQKTRRLPVLSNRTFDY